MTAKQVKIRRDSAANLDAATPADGELAYDTTNDQLRIGDGATTGGVKIPNSKMLQNQSMVAADAGGTADALTVTLSPVPAAYTAYLSFMFKATATNATTTPTINLNAIGAKNLKKKTAAGKANLAVGDIQSGCIYCGTYDGTDVQIESVGVTATTPTGTLIAETVYTVVNGTVTMTIASPCVITVSAGATSMPRNGSPIKFTTTGALPTGIVSGTTYYVANVGTDGATKFRVAATRGGSAINTSGSQSGTHTMDSPVYAKATNNPTTVEIEMVGGSGTIANAIGGAGAYAKLRIAAASLGASESIGVGKGAPSAAATASTFGTSSVSLGSWTLLPMAAAGGSSSTGGVIGTTGDPEWAAAGQDGVSSSASAVSNGYAIATGATATPFGGGGQGSGAGTFNAVGFSGKVVIREYT